MRWQDKYSEKIISAEEAVGFVKPGFRICIAMIAEPPAICQALSKRKDELKDVTIFTGSPQLYNEWFRPGWEEILQLNVFHVSRQNPDPLNRGISTVQQAMAERRIDFNPFNFSLQTKQLEGGRNDRHRHDLFFITLSPPDENGFCSFGQVMWNNKFYLQHADLVIAEIDPVLIRTYGDNFIHVSEIDYLVEQPPMDKPPRKHVYPGPEKHEEKIGEYAATLVKDGDTIELGGGRISFAMTRYLRHKNDLGVHTEAIPPGLIDLVRDGVITGKYKTLHPGKVVTTCCAVEPDELVYVDRNPLFELYEVSYVNNPRVIAANDNIVAINNAIAIDLTGQVNCESFGPQMWSGTGGQLDFVIGAMLSRGGRSITVIPATARAGKTSRIVPFLEPGTIVSVPRIYIDYVVTEFGIANLQGKSQRERAEALISIAHPDFRAELRSAAKKLFYP